MNFPATFRQTLTLHFVIVAVLPILLLGLFGIQYFKQKHLETTFSLLDTHALAVRHEAIEFLQYTSASLALVEKTLNSSFLHSDAEINQYLQIAVNEPSNFESIYLLDKQHKITHLGLLEGRDRNRQDYLGLDLSAHEVFVDQAQLSGYTWSDTFFSTLTAEPSITLGIPLENGTLLGTVSLKKLSAELIERLEHVEGNFQFSLLDHHGILIADSRPDLTSQRHNLRLHPEVRAALDNKVESPHHLHEDGSLLESVRLVPETGWVSYVSLPMQEAMQGVTPLRYLLTSVLTLAACLGVVLAIWLSRRMLRPILLLRDVAGEVAKGDYNQLLQPALYEELEDLSGSFREMISSVKDREQSIRESQASYRDISARLQLLINHMPFGCLMLDAENRVELWNPAAEQIFGFCSDEVVGLHPHEFLVPEHIQEETSQILERLKNGDSLALNINENLTRDGRTITCEWYNTPLQNPDGSIKGVISMVQDISQRVSAENALKESETSFRTMFQTNPDAILITRLSDGKMVSVNDHCLSTAGYTAEEIIGKTTLDINIWVNLDERDSYLNLIRNNGFVENFEMSLRSKSGRVWTGLASSRTLVLNDEICLLAVIRNITAMKQAESRLVRSESRFRSLISVMGEGVIILGHNGEIVQCNQAAERIMKVKADDIIGKFHYELIQGGIHEDGRVYSAAESPSSLTLQKGEPVTNQIIGLPQANGQTIWLQLNTHALGLDRSGKPVAVVVSFADVTRLKHIETELRESEQHMQTLSRQFQGVLEAIPDRIMILDAQMRVIWLNWFEDDSDPTGQKLSENLCCHDLPGVHCGPSSGADSFLCDNCPVQKALVSGRTEEGQTESSDGRTLSLRAFPVFNELGEVVNVIELAQDITESLRHQEQSMRTGQLAALGELAAGVAHEINNPINGVINYAQLILNKAVADSREQELSQRIIRESGRVATIVRELLYFAREESQEVHLITVLDALNEALALTKNQMNKDGVTLQIQMPDDLPMIKSHSHQIPRLFLNLISNARYALAEKHPDMDPDKILQVIGEEVLKDDQTLVRITFRDEGIGIDAELLPRIMNPFVTSKPSAQGTGLGLSISHEIVQKHGGTLTINSVQGEFTEVVIELPADK